MKTKIFVVLGVIAFFFIAIALNEYSHQPMAWCFKDKSTCAYEAMIRNRSDRDAKIATLQQQEKDTIDYYNPIINSFKPMLDGATISQELKAGRKENVPAEIVTFRSMLIPQALAASGDVMTDQQSNGQMRFAKQISVGRYGELLAELGSPYANVPIEQYCNKADLKQKACDFLVSIAQSESTSGTDFRCNWKSKEEAVKLGINLYHNPVGFKDKDINYPDSNGCWLRPFASFETFWEFYVGHMKKAYGFDTRTEVTSMYYCYVKGYCGRYTDDMWDTAASSDWVRTINAFVDKINKANS